MPRLDTKLTLKERQEYVRNFDVGRIYMAEVMDVRNVSKSGDLLVCPISGERDKKDSKNWVLASYASNFFGTTPYESNSSPSYEKDPQSFGAWFPIPCVGNYVFIFFPVTSSENVACFWFACPINPSTNYMIPGIPGAYHDKSHKALCERNDKSCNTSNTDKQNTDQTSNSSCSNILAKQKELNEKTEKSEKIQAEYKPINEALKRQGLEKDGVRGYSTAGAKRETPSMCYGIKTPLGNSFVMDDGWIGDDNKSKWIWSINSEDKIENGNIDEARKLVGTDYKSPWQREPNKGRDIRRNAGFRFRTRNGTQILVADEGTIYMINNDGSCWVEITKDGYLEGYSKKGVAISSDGDINLHTKKNVFIEADETIALRAKQFNIETGTENGKGDINISAPHINTDSVINCREINAEKSKLNELEAKGGKMIGEMGGTFYGLCGGSEIPGYPESNLKKMPKIEAFKLEEPKKEEKNDIIGKGDDEESCEKTKNSINTKVPTHEPYCGHCKCCKKSTDDSNESENTDNKEESKNNEKENNDQNKLNTEQKVNDNKEEYDSSKDELNPSCTSNNCGGCNGSSGSCNKSAPVTSCKGCNTTVTNQVCKNPTPNTVNKKQNTSVPQKQLSEHFTLPQLCYSETALANNINNVPNDTKCINNMQALSNNILEKIYSKYGNIEINSCYRCDELNSMVGGADTSQHVRGQAVDFYVPGISNMEVARWIESTLDFDQLILENCTDLENNPNSGWVHVSYNTQKNRHQTLTICRGCTSSGLHA